MSVPLTFGEVGGVSLLPSLAASNANTNIGSSLGSQQSTSSTRASKEDLLHAASMMVVGSTVLVIPEAPSELTHHADFDDDDEDSDESKLVDLGGATDSIDSATHSASHVANADETKSGSDSESEAKIDQ